jgi:hypothetical protein
MGSRESKSLAQSALTDTWLQASSAAWSRTVQPLVNASRRATISSTCASTSAGR